MMVEAANALVTGAAVFGSRTPAEGWGRHLASASQPTLAGVATKSGLDPNYLQASPPLPERCNEEHMRPLAETQGGTPREVSENHGRGKRGCSVGSYSGTTYLSKVHMRKKGGVLSKQGPLCQTTHKTQVRNLRQNAQLPNWCFNCTSNSPILGSLSLPSYGNFSGTLPEGLRGLTVMEPKVEAFTVV